VTVRTKAAVTKLSWRQALAWRMRRHHLVERAPASEMLEVTGRICGLHAQVTSSAELTLSARVDGLDRDAVLKALWEERSLVKLWAMRGTLHLLPAAEIGMWLAALGTYAHYKKPAWLRGFGITEKELERLITTIETALDGEHLTREELGAKWRGWPAHRPWPSGSRAAGAPTSSLPRSRGGSASGRATASASASRRRKAGCPAAYPRSIPTKRCARSRAATSAPTPRPPARTCGAGGACRRRRPGAC
jgi:Winged helix DNA-binding domain